MLTVCICIWAANRGMWNQLETNHLPSPFDSCGITSCPAETSCSHLAGGEAVAGNLSRDLLLRAALRFAACLFSKRMAPYAVAFMSCIGFLKEQGDDGSGTSFVSRVWWLVWVSLKMRVWTPLLCWFLCVFKLHWEKKTQRKQLGRWPQWQAGWHHCIWQLPLSHFDVSRNRNHSKWICLSIIRVCSGHFRYGEIKLASHQKSILSQ